MNKEKLQFRNRKKQKKPDFIKQDSYKRKRIDKKWSRPRGFQSKMRLKKRGYRKCVSPGYGSPKDVLGLDREGLEPVRINSEKDIESIDKENQGIVISSSTGMKKKAGMVKKAVEAEIKILNIKDPDSFLKWIEDIMKKRKEKKQKHEDDRKKKEAEKEKAKEKKESKLSEKLSEEKKKDQKKKEKDKALTKQEK